MSSRMTHNLESNLMSFILLGWNLKMDTYLCAQPQWLDAKNVTAKVSNKYLQKFGANPELGIIRAKSVCTYAATQIQYYIKMHKINGFY